MGEGSGVFTGAQINWMDLHLSAEPRGNLALDLAQPGLTPRRKVQVTSLDREGASRGQANALRPAGDQDSAAA
jgi:hypothetical protein